MVKQEPRPVYHRRHDVKKLQAAALGMPVRISDTGYHYAVHDVSRLDQPPLFSGRYEVVQAYLSGWRDATRVREWGKMW